MTIYALAYCMALIGNQCQIMDGDPNYVYHQTRESCERLVAMMDDNPDAKPGHPNRLWHECYAKEISVWRRAQ